MLLGIYIVIRNECKQAAFKYLSSLDSARPQDKKTEKQYWGMWSIPDNNLLNVETMMDHVGNVYPS